MSMRSERDDLIKKGILLPDSSLSPVSSAPSEIGDSAQASTDGKYFSESLYQFP